VASPGTRERILDTTAELFRLYGYTGTGLKQIVAAANAPFGSVYHHFPGGKEQLGGEVIQRAGRMYEELVTAVLDAAPDVETGLRDAFGGAAAVLVETDYADACPIETVALEVASTNETLRQATAQVFASWQRAAVVRFQAAGVPLDGAEDLALSVIALLEGAFVLARAAKDVRPMRAAGEAAVALYRARITGITSDATSSRASESS
jgi:AcrR family transcriptional regulator